MKEPKTPQLPTVVHRRKNNASDQFPDPMAEEPAGGWERDRLIQEWLDNPHRDPNRDPRNFPYPVYPRDPAAGKVVIEIDDSSRGPGSPAAPTLATPHYNGRGAAGRDASMRHDAITAHVDAGAPPITNMPSRPISMEEQMAALRAELAAMTRKLAMQTAANQTQQQSEIKTAAIEAVVPSAPIKRGPGRPPKPRGLTVPKVPPLAPPIDLKAPGTTQKDWEVVKAINSMPAPHSGASPQATKAYYAWIDAETRLGEITTGTKKLYMGYVSKLIRFPSSQAITMHVTNTYRGSTARVIRTAWARYYGWVMRNPYGLDGYLPPALQGTERASRAMPGARIDMERWQSCVAMLMIRHAIPAHRLAAVRKQDLVYEPGGRVMLMLRDLAKESAKHVRLTTADMAALEVMFAIVGSEYLMNLAISAPLIQIRTSDGIEPAGEHRLNRAEAWASGRLNYVRETISESCIHILGWTDREARERVMDVIDEYLDHSQIGPMDYLLEARIRITGEPGDDYRALQRRPIEGGRETPLLTRHDEDPYNKRLRQAREQAALEAREAARAEAHAVESELLPPSALLAMAKRAGSTPATVGDHDAPAAVVRAVEARASVQDQAPPQTTVADDEEVIEL